MANWWQLRSAKPEVRNVGFESTLVCNINEGLYRTVEVSGTAIIQVPLHMEEIAYRSVPLECNG